MLIVVLFITMAVLCCSAAALCGGWEGRWAGISTLAVIFAGRVVGTFDLELATSPGFKLWLDGSLLLLFLAIMLHSRRWWPIWIAGLQANCVLAHLSALAIPAHSPSIYRGLESFWGVPMVVVMAAGALMDRAAQERRPD